MQISKTYEIMSFFTEQSMLSCNFKNSEGILLCPPETQVLNIEYLDLFC